MAPQQTISARRLAVDILSRIDPKRAYVAPILDKLLGRTDQKQRTTDLVFGTLRNRNAIDTIITTLSGRPVTRIPKHVLNILRVAVCELTCNPDTPVYSIVNEAVENAKKLAGARQTGFVNAVLRKITGHITERKSPLPDDPSTAILPQTPRTGCLFDTDILPSFSSSPIDYLSAAFSLPNWLIAQWHKDFGLDETLNICFGSNRRPTVYIRPNRLKTSADDLAEMFRQAEVDVRPVPEAPVMAVKSPHNIRRLPGFDKGLFTVQDLTASLPVATLAPQPQWKILDLCAAPGVKTTQIAEITADKATIIATDINSKRLDTLRQNVARLSIESITAVEYEHLDRTFREIGPFDAILLDVPCSNTGVLARRVEARHRLKPKTVEDLVKTQSDLLETAAGMISPTGRICYSTCSALNAENGDLIRSFLASHDTIALENEQLTLPSAARIDHDGGYFAILRSTQDAGH